MNLPIKEEIELISLKTLLFKSTNGEWIVKQMGFKGYCKCGKNRVFSVDIIDLKLKIVKSIYVMFDK